MKSFFLFLLQFLVSIYSISQPCAPFGSLGILDNSYLYKQFHGSVLKIENDDTGTGFILDLEKGYIMTASHVIKAHRTGKDTIISASSDSFEGKIRLKVIKDLEGNGDAEDLALLMPLENSDLQKIQSYCTYIEPSLRLPEKGCRLISISYPGGITESIPKDLKLQQYKVDSSGLYHFTGDVVGGDSGAPILNENGLAIGIIVSYKGLKLNSFVPMWYALELLKEVPLSTNMIDLDGKLRKGELSEQALRFRLEHKLGSKNSLKNLDLISWAYEIKSNVESYRNSVSKFRCPIIPSYWNRKIEELAFFLAPLNAIYSNARTCHRLGDKYLQSGFIDNAKEYYSISEDYYRKSIEEFNLANPQYLSPLFKKGLSIDDFNSALKTSYQLDNTVIKEINIDMEKANFLSALFKDFALVLYYKSDLVENITEKNLLLSRGLLLSSFAFSVTESENFKAGAYGLTGDILKKFDNYLLAKNAYALSWKNGNTNTWVIENWQLTSSKINQETKIDNINNDQPNLTIDEISKFLNMYGYEDILLESIDFE